MIDRAALLSDLQALLKRLEADLLQRSESADVPQVGQRLREEYQRAKKAERTGQNYEDWRSDAITQAAAAWVLSCVFVRFLEDNRLIDPPKIAGPGDRLQRARDEHELYFRAHPKLTDRDYLLAIFDELAVLPGTKDVFGQHNPIRELPGWLSGDAAGELLRFFQKIDANTGVLVHDFTDQAWDTRFLGDLYQDLSEAARKKYALLQTPEFVEEFILDRTLEPALEEFGLAGFRMIDPACGSGHFLLGTFPRILGRWQKTEPGASIRDLVQRTLDSIYGVDVNPYAVVIARFRLLLVAIKACGIARLAAAPAFSVNLVCGDSLLHAPLRVSATEGQRVLDFELTDEGDECNHVYASENLAELKRLLRPGNYHAVVANPPYITPKDHQLNERYRKRFTSCHRQYSLAVPFMEQIFRLAVAPLARESGRAGGREGGGYTGQITANSFMKREFGKKLIEELLPTLDLTHVIDTSGAHIPGHGTPTVILLGRNRPPSTRNVRVVLGIEGELARPTVPSQAPVWRSIVDNLDSSSFENDKVSVKDISRDVLCQHPWSLSGGGATELRSFLETSRVGSLGDAISSIGYYLDAHEDEAFMQPIGFASRHGIASGCRAHVRGEFIRDWRIDAQETIIFPYDEKYELWNAVPHESRWGWFHALRTALWNRAVFGGGTYRSAGRKWFEFHQFPRDRARVCRFIVYGFFATHNHFALNEVPIAFSRSAPVMVLPAEATEDVYFGLLAVLNSSVFCFWSKQVFHDKGGGGIGGGLASEKWERFYEYTANGLSHFPLCCDLPSLSCRGRKIHALASVVSPCSSAQWARPDQRPLIAQQEELDWQCYRLYRLLDENLTTAEPPPVDLGQRAFEIVMARKMAAGELETTWFQRHSSRPITELPDDWPEDYRRLVERRIQAIKDNPNIALMERPEYKRRWNTEPWESQLERALRTRLLGRLESYFDFDGRMKDEGKPTAQLDIALTSVARLADVARQDPDFMQVGEVYRDDPAFDVERLVAELVEAESVPLLPALRYKPSGLRKRAEWEQTWELQREEDRTGKRLDISVPPKYTSADFLKSDYWRLRGKLDVPKERWVSFPHCEGPDGKLVIAWAGYDHLQLARSVSAYYVDIQERLGGRDDPRLVPLLACLLELLPWLKQWHNEPDPNFGGMRMGDHFEGFITEEARQLGKTIPEIKAWQPPQRAGGRGRRKATT